jgi:type VI secretion system protein ImpM
MSTQFINTVGYYGKVPIRGDFISKGLPRSFIEPWDIWLQEAIFTSQEQLGSQWLDKYLTSPIYHFVLSPGICGESAWLGVLMPSVDKVGRYYPMTISSMLDANINPYLAIQKKQWFANLEKLALSCLHDNYDLDEFNKGIDKLQQENIYSAGDSHTLTERLNQKIFHTAWQQSLDDTDLISELLPSILDSVLKEQCFAYSLWWTKGSELIAPSFLFSEGLPPFDGVTAMFDGNWQRWGWQRNYHPAPSGQYNDNCNDE